MIEIRDIDLKRARWFSFMLPGLGQVYLGAYLRGMALFLGFTLLTLLPEARLLLPLAALLAAAEVGKFRGKKIWVGSGIWEQMPSWARQFQKLFENRQKVRKSRPAWYTGVGVIGFCAWMMLFAPALYPFQSQSQVNDDVERIADHARNFRARVGRLPAGLEELPQDLQLKDPWGTPYLLKPVELGFEVRSWGPDKKPRTPDDFIYRYR